MEHAPALIMLSSHFRDFINDMREVDSVLVNHVIEKYGSIASDKKEFSVLEERLKGMYPSLFLRTLRSDDTTALPLRDINNNNSHTLPTSSAIGDILETIDETLDSQREYIQELQNKIGDLFPSGVFKHDFRIKDFEPKHLEKNTQRILLDVVGMRIVPQKTRLFPQITAQFEEEFKGRITFKFNTFSYSRKELKRDLGPFSTYYRAIHYYLPIKNFFMEVQIRTPSIDQWSIMHHDTVYKPLYPVSQEIREDIMEFGRMSNIVDYFELLEH